MSKVRDIENSVDGSKILLIFGNTVSLVSILILFMQNLRSNDSEIWDRYLYLISIFCGLYVVSKALFSKTYNFKYYPFIAFFILLIGVVGIERHSTKTTRGVDISKEFWLGFGSSILILTLIITPAIYTIYSWQQLNRKIQIILNLIAFLVLVCLVPALLQGGNSIIDRGSSEYNINENLAIAAGHFPYVDFIPQYGTLYAWLIAPLKGYLDVDSLVTVSLYMMSIGALVAIAIGVWISYKAMNSRSLGLAILLVVPLTSIAQFPNRSVYSGTIYALLSQLPVRILPGMLLGLFLFKTIIKNQSEISASKIVLSFFAGLTIWINQDFAILSGLITIFFLIFYMKKFLNSLFILASFSFGVIIYPIILLFFGKQIQPGYIGFFATQYNSGFMAEPIITPGPILIILPLLISLVSVSVYVLVKDRYFKAFIDQPTKLAILVTAYFSIWSLVGFLYYLNRSYASGQMQILFLPISVASASFFGYIFGRNLSIPWTVKSFFTSSNWTTAKLKRNIYYLLCAMMMSLPLSSIIAFPNPQIEFDRLTNASSDHRWPKPNLTDSIKDAKFGLSLAKEENLKIAFYGASSNYMKLATGIDSVNIYNSPWDMPVTSRTVQVGCERILSSMPDLIVLGDEAPALFRFSNNTLCDKFAITNVAGLRENRLAVKVD